MVCAAEAAHRGQEHTRKPKYSSTSLRLTHVEPLRIKPTHLSLTTCFQPITRSVRNRPTGGTTGSRTKMSHSNITSAVRTDTKHIQYPPKKLITSLNLSKYTKRQKLQLCSHHHLNKTPSWNLRGWHQSKIIEVWVNKIVIKGQTSTQGRKRWVWMIQSAKMWMRLKSGNFMVLWIMT